MVWCLSFMVVAFCIMILSTLQLNIPFIFVGFSFLVVSLIIAMVLESKKKQKNNLPKKEKVKPISQSSTKNMYKYVCNNKSFVFHRPECSFVKDKYKKEYSWDSDSIYDYGSDYKNLISCGYKPCNKCKPR